MKPSRKSLTKKLDTLWSQMVKERDAYLCRWCKSSNKNLNSAHIVSRTYRSTRWNLDNGLCLCISCHFRAHQNPLMFAEFVKKELGEGLYYDLIRLGNVIQPITLFWLESKLVELREL